MTSSPIDIDGSVLEGGGQVLRLSLAFSVLSGRPIRVSNIRSGRKKPGLMAQHLKGLKLLSEMSQANVEGAEMGSTRIEFKPNRIKSGFYTADTQTAGSISLLLQVGLPCALYADKRTTLDLLGGTNADMAPQLDYTTEVFRPMLEHFNASFDFELIRRGYYPKGGGHVRVKINPIKSLKPIEKIEQGKPVRIYGWAYVAGVLPLHIAHRMANSASNVIHEHLTSISVKVECYQEQKHVAPIGNGSGMILVLETATGCILGCSALGNRNVSAEQSGIEAAQELIDLFKTGACVDNYNQDQLIIFMALADGVSQIRIGPMTKHTETAIYIAEQITNIKFEVIPDGNNSFILKCKGIGLRNPHFN